MLKKGSKRVFCLLSILLNLSIQYLYAHKDLDSFYKSIECTSVRRRNCVFFTYFIWLEENPPHRLIDEQHDLFTDLLR
jgi:hypothetical protein